MLSTSPTGRHTPQQETRQEAQQEVISPSTQGRYTFALPNVARAVRTVATAAFCLLMLALLVPTGIHAQHFGGHVVRTGWQYLPPPSPSPCFYSSPAPAP